MKYAPRKTDHRIVEEAQSAYAENPAGMVDRILAGLSVEEFDTLREMLGLSVDQMAGKIGISVATLSRRRAKRQLLDRDHSDRLMRYARLYWQAVDYFEGDAATARDWLARPARGLAGRSPLEFAETEMGAREVEDLIGRLEHGVYV
ncbi:MAG TPA: antitoxin Xre/MbcA/ParS toxin-binding domain-containing protein [Opitutales bacterium]|nr:antitoxin Xre/MbcA/ParS toxin-binding domain-containing protein [Opitutales bacterium]